MSGFKRKLRRSLTTLIAVALLVACADSGDPAAAGSAAPADTLRAIHALTIGEVDGDPNYLFGDITSIAADAEGKIYVADAIGSMIRVYAQDGRYLHHVGQEGDGPGEFQWPADITFDREGKLWVRDGSRITALASPGAAASSARAESEVLVWPLPGYGNLNSTRSLATSEGRYFYPHERIQGWEVQEHVYQVFQDGEITDTLRVPHYPTAQRTIPAVYWMSSGSGRMLEGLSAAPFSPIPSWDITPNGTIISGDGADYILVETDVAGDTLRTIQGPDYGRGPVPEAEHADSARALQERIDSLPVPLEDVENVAEEIRQGVLPEVLPAFLSIHVALNGHIWIERWPAEGQGSERSYDVFDAAGALQGLVVLPAPLVRDPPPFFTNDAVYGVIRDPLSDVERVVKLELSPAAGG